ncbi:MAG: serine hydrolase domain-containing protein [Puniceicoccales bacterium]
MIARKLACASICLGCLHPALADLASDIQSIVAQHQDTTGIPGVIVGVWRGDTPVTVFTRGFGNVDSSTPIQTTDHTRMGSITKSFTVTRIMQLAQDGLISLDDPISQYVPSVQNGSATLRQLANMTSGIYNYTADTAFAEALFDDLNREWTPQQLIDVANSNAPRFTPGERWEYSNTNTVLLGMVVEQVTGTSLAEDITTNLLTPLGLNNTYYPTDSAMPSPYAHGYIEIPEGYEDITQMNPSSSAGAGAMVGSLEDLRSWAEILATGANILSPEFQAVRLQMLPADSIIDGPEYDFYGLGIGEIDGWFGHTGAYLGYQSLALYDPVNDQTTVILTNLMYGPHIPTDIFREISPLLVPEPMHYTVFIGLAGLTVARIKRRKARKAV